MLPSGAAGVTLISLPFLLLLYVLGIILASYFRPRASEKRWLATHGKRISATVVKIDLRPWRVRGAQGYYYSVQARWEDQKTGKVHLVESGWVPRAYLKSSENPSLSRDIAPGEPIEVLTDPNDPDHAMIAALPPKISTYYGEY